MRSDESMPRQSTEDFGEHEREGVKQNRACTDVLFLFVFIGALICLGWTFVHILYHGDLRRLYHGIDFYGNVCGVDPIVADSPYLFWCAVPDHAASAALPGGASGTMLYSPTSQLDLAHPICVQSCPSMDLGAHSCYQSALVVDETPNADTGTFTQTVTYNYLAVGDYNTSSYGYRYCMPDNLGMRQQVLGAVNGDPIQYAFSGLAQIGRAWSVLIIAALMAIGLGYAYLCGLETKAAPVIYTCLGIAIIIPFLFGVAMIITAYMPNINIFSTGVANADLIIGIGLVLLSLHLILVYVLMRKSLQVSIKCVLVACECIWSMETMVWEPLFSLCIKMLLFLVLLIGFFGLISCGDIERPDIHRILPSGLGRKFTYGEDEKYLLTFYVFMAIWLLELCTSLSQFALAYAAQLWYFRDPRRKLPRFPTMQGYAIGIGYHLGSLAFGAFLITLTRPVRIILSCLLGRDKEKPNSVRLCIDSCASCITYCFERCIRFINKNAYMSMALSSQPFCEAAQDSFRELASRSGEIGILLGACWVFMLTGVLAIAIVCAFFTWLVIVILPVFGHQWYHYYMAYPVTIAGASGLICALIAIAFMVLIDTVADTILFCYAVTPSIEDGRRRAGKPRKFEPPLRLQEAIPFGKAQPR